MNTLDKIKQMELVVEEIAIILMILLSLGGIAVMEYSPTEGYWYWIVVSLIFGLLALLIGYLHGKSDQETSIWMEQSLLWFGVLLALCGTLLLVNAGSLTDTNAGLVILLILSLATYIDGTRIGWRFSLVGNFLGLTAVVIAYYENFMWILYSLAAVSIAVVVYWKKRQTGRAEE